MAKDILVVILIALLTLAIYGVDINADRINEVEYENAELKRELLEAHKETESCIMENSILNDRIDETVRKFS